MKAILRCENVTKRFGGLVAVDNVSFLLKKGEFVGLIGPNGAGKTTLFNCITGYYKPDNGRIYFKDVNITGKPPYVAAKLGIGRTFQIVKPMPKLTVLENVIVSSLLKAKDIGEAYEKSLEILEYVGLYEKRMLPAASLNVAEKKRLELARALSLDSEIILLDEVVAGLNPTETDKMLDLLKDIHKKKITVLMVEHVMRAVMRISERVIVLHHGKKIAEGTPKEIVNNPQVIEVYLGKEEI